MCVPSQTVIESSRIKHVSKAFFFDRWGEAYVAMFTAYFDVSGDPSGSEVLSVAGFIAHASQWVLFERRWKKILVKFGVSSLHMKDFAHSTGEFKAWKMDEVKRRAFLSALVSVILRTARHSFATSLYIPDYLALDSIRSIRRIRSPLAIAGCTVLQHVRNWAIETGIDINDILFIFEDGDVDKANFFEAAVNDLKISPIFMTKAQSAAFQAADLLAYEHRLANLKVIPDSGVFEMEDLRQPFQSLNSIPNGEGRRDWTVQERAELEETLKELWPRLGLIWQGQLNQ